MKKKRKAKIGKGDVVQVKWFDITVKTGWHSKEKTEGRFHCQSIGYMTSINKKTITISQTISEWNDASESMTIPLVNCLDITKIT